MTLAPSQHETRDELVRILDQGALDILFQPIVRTHDHGIFGYEALVRGPRTSALHEPAALFPYAADAGRLVELDLLCQRRGIERFAALGLEGKLFLNILSDTLAEDQALRDNLDGALRAAGLDSSRIVLELTEHQPLPAHSRIVEVLHGLRQRGFWLALDDVGEGHNGLRLWHALLPDFIKIDRHFIHLLNEDPARRKFVGGMADLAHRLGCQIIAEGVEELSELDWLTAFDVPLAQGFLFGVPLAEPLRKIILPDIQLESPAQAIGGVQSQAIERLLKEVVPLPSHTCVDDAGTRFIEHPSARYIPVVDEGVPVGILWRDAFMNMYARRFAPELHGRKPIAWFMDKEVLIADARLSIESMSRRITQKPGGELPEAFIITRAGRYAGMGEVKELLRILTDLQMRNARHANPLSGLPGNVLINDTMAQWLAQKIGFVAAYIDLDQFKAFNDVYGYQKGDEAILLLAETLRRHFPASDGETDFIGHVGGDDFVVLTQREGWELNLHAVLNDFAQRAAMLYSPEDRQRGGILAQDRHGEMRLLPLMSVSIGAVPCPPGRFQSHHEISNRLAEVKKQAKAITGNSLFIDRRGHEKQAPEGPSTTQPILVY